MNNYSFSALVGQPSCFPPRHVLPLRLLLVVGSRFLFEAGSINLSYLSSSSYPSQDSVPETVTWSWPYFIVSLYNVWGIKLIYNTYLGTLKSLSKSVLCLPVYSLQNALVLPSETWNIAIKSHRQIKFLFVYQMTPSVIIHTISSLTNFPSAKSFVSAQISGSHCQCVLVPSGTSLQRSSY